jgi:CUE domain
VTKYFVTSLIASSTFTSLLSLKPYTHIQIVPHLLHQWQWWRIPIWMASYSNAGEVLFACLTIYNLRGLERIFGSRQYAVPSLIPPESFSDGQSFLTFSYLTNSILAPLLLALLFRPLSANRLNYLPPGPTAVLFSLLPLYIHNIPPSYTLHVGANTPRPQSPKGLTVTDKWAMYLLYTQLALSQFPGSLICAATGYLTGLCWQFSLVPAALKHFRLPRRLFGGEATVTQANARTARETVVPPAPQAAGGGPLAREFIDTISGRTERPEIEGARERDVESLMNMFPNLTRERAVAVLGRSQNSVERAVEALLEG